MLTAIILAATTSPPDETVYYILGSIALICGGALGLWRFLVRQRKRWIDEGQEKQAAVQAQKENSAQLKANTEAIAKLTMQMTDFMATMHNELSGLGRRVTHLEFITGKKGAGNAPPSP